MKKINVAVIGTGNLGQHHARVYTELEGVNLVGIVDTDKLRLKEISDKLKVPGFDNYREIIGKVDAVSVVTPTQTHYSIACDVMSGGIHCLVEKPITMKLDEAEKLIRLSEEKKVILQVGHIERFNPAVIEAQKYIKNPRFIEANRLGGYNPRVKDIGVVLDLMIHDIEISMYLVNSKIVNIEAYGAKVFSKHEDIVKVRLFFENGCIADLIASRISTGRYRKIRIFQEDSYISVDYMRQMLKIYRKGKQNMETMDDIEKLSPKPARGEPLKLELQHFIDCIREGKKPAVTGEHGRNALGVALEILNKLNA